MQLIYEVDYADSIRLEACIEKCKGDYPGRSKIYKEDFYSRSLLFSHYYRLIIDEHRKKIRLQGE